MQEDREYAYQCRLFCYFRYEFFKRSKAYALVQEIKESVYKNKKAGEPLFFDEIEETARQISPEALKAVELEHEYSSFGKVSGATAFVANDGKQIVKSNKDLTPFDNPFLMSQTMNIPISIKEILTLAILLQHKASCLT